MSRHSITLRTTLFVAGLGVLVESAGASTLRFANYGPPGDRAPSLMPSSGTDGIGSSAAEPSVGVNWNTGAWTYIASLETLKVVPDHCTSPPTATWSDISFPTTTVRTLDPILWTDAAKGRTYSSQLAGKCSLMAFTDDDGANWTPSQGCGINAGVDHQTIATGPFPAGDPIGYLGDDGFGNATYYCSQDTALAQCALSRDGGLTFGAAVPIYTQAHCTQVAGKLHGHLRVAPDGTVYVPFPTCQPTPLDVTRQAISVSTDAGATWTVRLVTESEGSVGSDPAVGIDADNKLYFGFCDGDGLAKVTTSTDRGVSWSAAVAVGPPGLAGCAFPQVVAGDAGRAAIAFLGTDFSGGGDVYGTDTTIPATWFLYAATTYDGGATFETVEVAPGDPVQRGCICQQGTLCEGGRNLLDFNETAVDAEGRVLIGYADGCVGGCVAAAPNSGTDVSRIAVQTGGRRLFAAFDPPPGGVAPESPLAAGTILNGIVTLRWHQPEDGGSAITGYNLYRQVGGAGPFTLLAAVGPGTFTHEDDVSAAPDLGYKYQVKAVNAVGEGVSCNDLVVAPPVILDPCTLPGVMVAPDIGDGTPVPDPGLDIESVSVAEPFLGEGVEELVITIKVASLATMPVDGLWVVLWGRPVPDGTYDRNYVAMKTIGTTPTFVYGKVAPANTHLADEFGAATGEVVADGTIRIRIDPSLADLDSIGPGNDLSNIEGRSFAGRGGILTSYVVSQSSATDFSAAGLYTLFGNDFCRANEAPVAQPDAASTDAGQAVFIPVLANDTDINADALQIVGFVQPANGEAVGTVDKKVRYTPDTDFAGVDTFTYKISDGHGGTASALVTVTVTNLPNRAPVAVGDTANTAQNFTVSIPVLANDSDPDGDDLSIDTIQQPSCGAATRDLATNTINFQPAANVATGPCCFSYTATDGHGGVANAPVCVNVTCSELPTGELFADFDAADGGFTVETPITGPGSIDWQRVADAPGMSFYSNDPAGTVKDDRLISPPVFLSGSSELQFQHRFLTEDTFDGGLLQVSTDNGASWQDIVTAGGIFTAGAYNSSITGHPDAWSGASENYPLNSPVTVTLASLVHRTARFRWVMSADSNTGLDGWHVDDVRVTNLLEVDPACTPPPCVPGDDELCYYTLPPCRLLDTRETASPLDDGAEEIFTLAGRCGVPLTARALSLNVTITQATGAGTLRLYPDSEPANDENAISFVAGKNRANNGVMALDLLGNGTLKAKPTIDAPDEQPRKLHLILDVNGYFE